MTYDCVTVPQGPNCAVSALAVFFDREATGAAGVDRSNDFLASYLAAFEDRNESDIANKKGIDYSLITEKTGLLSQFWQY